MTAILLISGSLRSGSTNVAMLRTAMAVAPASVEATLFDRIDALPHFNPDDDREGADVPTAVARLRAAIRAADALLFCVPEYAGALPGSFKNLLEWTVGDGGTYGKPVAWINASGPAAPTGGADAHESLRKVLAYVGADIVDDACTRIPTTRDGIGPNGTFGDPALRLRIRDILATLVRHVIEGRSAATESLSDAVARADDAFFAALLDGHGPAVLEMLADNFLIVEVRAGTVVTGHDFVAAITSGDVTSGSSAPPATWRSSSAAPACASRSTTRAPSPREPIHARVPTGQRKLEAGVRAGHAHADGVIATSAVHEHGHRQPGGLPRQGESELA